jgi:AcrR family transcriptional regulator
MTVELEGLTPRIEGGSDGEEALPPRRLRADGQRNRERLTEVAKLAFAELGADVSLDEIARRAGVGIGTLYRHFPTRDAIIEAVYRREVEQLAGSAARLLASLSPGEALHEWMRLFVDYIATKKVMASAIGAIVANTPEPFSSTAPASLAISAPTSIRTTFCAPSSASPTAIPARGGRPARYG